ncbi:BrnT family toxin [Streptomyces sp. uw30]|uniref:BrnT family toxin n=1 Tax=Streptomyces sp. uw30 TaxID=1828179 RepID=UPI0011CD8046|nr:BrnT family toxin [Streptomyces sp. uw30]TXS40182.1 BrnT family toxin [Streptomyces sp. uw30]
MRVDELIWDDWNEEHIAKHGVSPEEVEDACQTKPVRARLVRDDTYALLGVTNGGRHLAVFLARRGKNIYYVVTARDMDVRERKSFGRR